MVKNEKSFWKSKTVWINILGLSAGVLTAVQGELVTGGSLTVAALVNIVLRVVTKSGIKF